MRLICLPLIVMCFGCAEPQLKTVKWPDLEKAIAAHKNKVVIVDVWANYCVPCKQKMPKVAELQKKYADKGVVLITVSLDDADEAPKALEFLKKQKITSENYCLDEKPDLIDEKIGGSAVPIYCIYGRDGKRSKTLTPIDAPDIDDIEKEVKKLVDK